MAQRSQGDGKMAKIKENDDASWDFGGFLVVFSTFSDCFSDRVLGDFLPFW